MDQKPQWFGEFSVVQDTMLRNTFNWEIKHFQLGLVYDDSFITVADVLATPRG
jgi:hypothetical protein